MVDGQGLGGSQPQCEHVSLAFEVPGLQPCVVGQVHPDDAYGATMQPPDLGKTEAWVILHSEPDSVIYSGLKAGVDRESLRDDVGG